VIIAVHSRYMPVASIIGCILFCFADYKNFSLL